MCINIWELVLPAPRQVFVDQILRKYRSQTQLPDQWIFSNSCIKVSMESKASGASCRIAGIMFFSLDHSVFDPIVGRRVGLIARSKSKNIRSCRSISIAFDTDSFSVR